MRWLALTLILGCHGGGLGKPCGADRDCPAPEKCVAGACAAKGFCIGSAACSDDSVCDPGSHCANGCCEPGESGSCLRDADCSAHPQTPVCDTSSGTCVACVVSRDCGVGAVCQNNTCVELQVFSVVSLAPSSLHTWTLRPSQRRAPGSQGPLVSLELVFLLLLQAARIITAKPALTA